MKCPCRKDQWRLAACLGKQIDCLHHKGESRLLRVNLSWNTVTGGRRCHSPGLHSASREGLRCTSRRGGLRAGAVSPRPAGLHCGPTNARLGWAGALENEAGPSPREEVAGGRAGSGRAEQRPPWAVLNEGIFYPPAELALESISQRLDLAIQWGYPGHPRGREQVRTNQGIPVLGEFASSICCRPLWWH